MECPHCNGNGWLGRVKVVASNIMLRVCNVCSSTWIEGDHPIKAQSIKLSDFIKARNINPFNLIDVAEDAIKK